MREFKKKTKNGYNTQNSMRYLLGNLCKSRANPSCQLFRKFPVDDHSVSKYDTRHDDAALTVLACSVSHQRYQHTVFCLIKDAVFHFTSTVLALLAYSRILNQCESFVSLANICLIPQHKEYRPQTHYQWFSLAFAFIIISTQACIAELAILFYLLEQKTHYTCTSTVVLNFSFTSVQCYSIILHQDRMFCLTRKVQVCLFVWVFIFLLYQHTNLMLTSTTLALYQPTALAYKINTIPILAVKTLSFTI